jgi:hypothetical protein
MELTEDELFESDSTLQLRLAFWEHYYRAIASENPDEMIEDARVKLQSYVFEEESRLERVREVLLRILDSQQRKYRQIVDRDVVLSSPVNS